MVFALVACNSLFFFSARSDHTISMFIPTNKVESPIQKARIDMSTYSLKSRDTQPLLSNGNTQATAGYGRPEKPVAVPALPVGRRGDCAAALVEVSLDAHEACLSLVTTAA